MRAARSVVTLVDGTLALPERERRNEKKKYYGHEGEGKGSLGGCARRRAYCFWPTLAAYSSLKLPGGA